LWDQFRRKILLVDAVSIVRREVVTGVVEGTDPEFGVKVHLAVGVEDCVTALVGAADWFIGQGLEGGIGCMEFGEGVVEGTRISLVFSSSADEGPKVRTPLSLLSYGMGKKKCWMGKRKCWMGKKEVLDG
jgi:hypothetical protein